MTDASDPAITPSADDRGESVPTVSDVGFSVTTMPWQITPPEDVIVVIVKGTFDLVPNAPATLRDESELPEDDAFEDDDLERALVHAGDFAIMKPEVDVLVEGHVYAIAPQPGSKGTTAMQAAVRVRGAGGAVDRAIAVFGDRAWAGAALTRVPSDPSPFESIPLTYARAFGGPNYAANPNGVGAGAEPSSDGVRRMPNFEEIGKLVTSPDASPPPAGLSGIHPEWAARRRFVGTFDKAWYRERWPYYPRDFDWHYFQSAPPNQRLPRANGDEEYELVGVHPAHGRIAGRLAGLRARVFAKRYGKDDLVDVPVRLDTISFAPDDGAVHLVWRGHLPVTSDDAPEIEALFATTEPVAGPAVTLADARDRYVRAVAEPAEEDDDDAPDEEPEAARETEEDVEARKIDAQIAEIEADILGRQADAGVTSEPVPEPDPEVIAALLREAEADEEDVQEVLAGMRGEERAAPPEPKPEVRALVEERLKSGESLAGVDLRGVDLSDLDLAGADLEELDFSHARFDRSNLSRASLVGSKFVAASFVAANLAGATASDADFTEARLIETNLVGARFERVEARGACAEGADFTKANLEEAIFGDADFTRAKLDEALLGATDFTGATLERATFRRAAMVDVRLYDVRGEKVIFDGADLTNARAEGAKLPGASLRDVVADGSVWERATLSNANFLGASLRDASFNKARCDKTIFGEVDLRAGRLLKARLTGAMLVKANLMDARLDRAILDGADLRGANLHGASLLRTSLKGAQLDQALITYSDLDRRQG